MTDNKKSPWPMQTFIPLKKVEVDGDKVTLWGYGAIEEPDHAGEIMDYLTSKPKFVGWSNKIFKATGGISKGNVRAQHGDIVAGHLIEFRPDDDNKGFWVGAEIDDANEKEKVKKGNYTGFSVGGSYANRWLDATHPGYFRYTANPVEISIVDSPCAPSATFQLTKADGAEPVDMQFEPANKGGEIRLGETSTELYTAISVRLNEVYPATHTNTNTGLVEVSLYSNYYIDTFDGKQVVCNAEGKKYVITYSKDESGVIQFGDPIEVTEHRVYTPVPASTDLAKAVPAAPISTSEIRLDANKQSNPDPISMEQMPMPNITLELTPGTTPATETLETHAVNTRDLSADFEAMLPKMGALIKAEVKAAVSELMAELKKADTSLDNQSPRMIPVKKPNRLKVNKE